MNARRRTSSSTTRSCSFSKHFNPLVDFVPDHYDRQTMDEAIAAVPYAVMTEGPLLWGTAEQASAKLAAFGDAGLRHVVLAPVSGLFSRRAALYAFWAIDRIARSLSRRRGLMGRIDTRTAVQECSR